MSLAGFSQEPRLPVRIGRALARGRAPPEPEDDDAGLLFATYLFPELAEWQPLLARLCVGLDRAAFLAAEARRNGSDFQSELLASETVSEERFYRALAAELGLGYVARLEPERLIVRDRQAEAFLHGHAGNIPVKIAGKDGATSFLIAPERLGLRRLRSLVAGRAGIVSRLRITSPGVLRAALFARLKQALVKKATSDLFDRFPAYSARIVANAWQGLFCGAAVVGFFVALAMAPAATWMALHIFFSFFFLACVGLRVAALKSSPRPCKILAATATVPAGDLPTYSLLVALYKEAEIAPQLVAALDRLVWPKSKIEIKLVCEGDDAETLAALRALPLPRSMEIIEVPTCEPRTKPKALAYALPLVSGEFVALYDAEDDPHPMQLVEAWQKFQASGPNLACVQAPLEISNRDSSLITLMFGFEYAALFRGLLPWLSAKRLFLPLGGTSNHFRGLT